jgi:hypothetical protein
LPVKIWEIDNNGLSSKVVTDWDTLWTAEEYREDAEELDRCLDTVLDSALQRVTTGKKTGASPGFLRAWAVGRALEESGVYNSPALRNERRQLLWRALAVKCRIGARATHEQDKRWQELRPSTAREPRREGGRLDYFEMCRWLAEQDLEDAIATFGGSVRNVWQMLERPALRPISLRSILKEWFAYHPNNVQERLFQQNVFADIMKTLRKRWPDRGPGSAKKPVHYSDKELEAEVRRLLGPFAEQIWE